ncbi:DUF5518 domain-containing protein [Halobacterium yunchengense]|uniref:DUF5518 domain-containing protein n=1 Tax=Halobacterium yunchengense TaxID=3108497 RepID=UPI0030084445
MPAPTESPADAPSSLFYDRLLDYLLVALLVVEGLVVAALGATVATADVRSFAERVAADAAASGELPLGYSEQALADAIRTLVAWGGGGLAAAGVLLVAAAAWFYRYRGRVRDRLADGRRPPRWHAVLLGAALATALAFVPFVQVAGGAVAGHLTDRGALVDGALAGVLFGAPAYVVWGAVAAGAVAAGAPALVGFVAFGVLVYVAVDAVLAAVGGLIGGFVA